MAIRNIVKFGDDTLRKTCKPVDAITKRTKIKQYSYLRKLKSLRKIWLVLKSTSLFYFKKYKKGQKYGNKKN